LRCAGWEPRNGTRAILSEPQMFGRELALFRELGDEWGMALAMFSLAGRVQSRRQCKAEKLWEEGLSLFRQSGDRWGMAVTLSSFGYIARLKGITGRQACFLGKASPSSASWGTSRHCNIAQPAGECRSPAERISRSDGAA